MAETMAVQENDRNDLVLFLAKSDAGEIREELWPRIRNEVLKRKLKKGETLFSVDENEHGLKRGGSYESDKVFLVISGEIGMEIPSALLPQGDVKSVTVRVRRGAVIGWHDERSFCSAQTISGQAEVLEISFRAMNVLLEYPALARRILFLQSHRCRPYLRKIQVLMEEIPNRIKLELEDLLKLLREVAPDPAVHTQNGGRPRITHLMIAQSIGSSRETVTRTICENSEILELVKELSPWVNIVKRGGKLLKSESEKRALLKSQKMVVLAREIIRGLYVRQGLKPSGQKFRRDYEFVLGMLLSGLKPGVALTEPEKKALEERRSLALLAK